MTQLRTHIPNSKSIPHPSQLRLTPRTPTVREGPPPASQKPQAPTPSPQDSSPKTQPVPSPQADSPLERLLSLYLDETLTLADIAFTLSLSITETLARTSDPEFLKLLEIYTAAQEKRAEFLARAGRATAARTFARLAEYSDKPETARKAAADIIRMQPKNSTQQIKPETRISAVRAYIKHPTPNIRELLAPILGPDTSPRKSTALAPT